MGEYSPTSKQMTGSEYGGVEETTTGVQPKPEDALSNTERLRLVYLTGQEDDPEALIDRRAMMGLSTEGRPHWLGGTGKQSHLETDGVMNQ